MMDYRPVNSETSNFATPCHILLQVFEAKQTLKIFQLLYKVDWEFYHNMVFCHCNNRSFIVSYKESVLEGMPGYEIM